MPDNLTKKRPEDSQRINLNQPYEVQYWCDKFDCTEDDLQDAVDAVGNSAADVQTYLNPE